MFEFEDLSSGFHDVFLNKYADSSGPILDFYISDSMQDMLDIDIKSEVATVVGGATNEFSAFGSDLPSLDFDFSTNDNEIKWLGEPKWTGATDFYTDIGACVNPNSVMPLITNNSILNNSSKNQLSLNSNNLHSINSPPTSPKNNKSHLTFSPHQIKVPVLHEDVKSSSLPSLLISSTNSSSIVTVTQTSTPTISNGKSFVQHVKKNLSSDLVKNEVIEKTKNSTSNNSSSPGTNTIKLAPGIGGLTFSNSISYNKLKQSNNNLKISVLNENSGLKVEKDSPIHKNHQTNNGNIYNGSNILNSTQQQNINKILPRNVLVNNKNLTGNRSASPCNHSPTVSNNNNAGSGNIKKTKPVEHEYPKPAYSYSCLIAMALKNSRRGSLPVSEIYNFMCEHFPYFKTAPTGWKNSVRHNLSLNKCFEKIEKPVTNGGQRKGCLWAMNPSKITKMDEEVQKWSRKDPMAIRKAMVYPENLEALERGEMKHGSIGDSDAENEIQSDVEENESDSEAEHYLKDNLVEIPEYVEDEDNNENDSKSFKINANDIYKSFCIEDEKEPLRISIRKSDIIDMNDIDFISTKKARLDVNYSISPANAASAIQYEQRIQYQQQQSNSNHSRRKMQLVNRIA